MYFFKTKKRPWRRRNYFIKKGFQARFIAKFLGVVMAGSAMSGYIMYLLTNHDVEEGFYRTHIKLASTGELLMPTLLKVNFGVLAVILAVVAVITLFISHKVAGPLLRLGRDTERIARGDFTGNFKLRTNDELKSLAKAFEEMNADLKDSFKELRAQADEMDKAAEGLMFKYAYSSLDRLGKTDESAREQVKELSSKVDLFGKKLSRFKLEKKAGGRK